jgi:cell division protein FtsQ
LKARSRKRKKSARFRLFVFAFLVALIGLAVYFVLSLPIWRIQDVVINGAKMLSAEEIKNMAGIPLSDNLFLTSFARTRNVLRKISAIKSFHIYRIPPGTVLIQIEERGPVAVIVLNDQSAIVDESGYILNRNPRFTLNVPNIIDLPVISGVGKNEIINGERIDPKSAKLINDIVVELATILGSRRIQIDLGDYERISLVLDDILRVKIGNDKEVKRKMEIFKGLLPTIASRWTQVEYIDVRYPDTPVLKYR